MTKEMKKAQRIMKQGFFVDKDGEKHNLLSYTVFSDGWVSLSNASGKYFKIEEVSE